VREFNLTPFYCPHREHEIHFIKGNRYTAEDIEKRPYAIPAGK